MLLRLDIENFILIDRLSLDFFPGICVLTGETGAGKSILIDAVTAILGGRIGPDAIRQGADRARLEATFRPPGDLSDWLLESGIEPAIAGELTVAREITARGSRSRVEGVQVSQGALRALADRLVDILGQHEHTLLTRAREHLHLLDRFGGPSLEIERQEVARQHATVQAASAELTALRTKATEREREQGFWRYQLQEIEAARLGSPSEVEDLQAERLLLANAETLREELSQAHEALTAGDDSLSDRLGRVIAALRDAADLDPELAPLAESLDAAVSAIEDASREVRRRSERLEADPERLSEVETRLDLLRDLLKKYGPTVQDVQRYQERIGRDLQAAETVGVRQEELERLRDAARQALSAGCHRLSAARQEAARRLEAAVDRELADLGMKEARFSVSFRPHEAPTAEGAESAEFLLAANPGEPPRPLARTASGGELSRLMLALKTVLAGDEAAPTLIFDEVDTGISGRAAQVVAQKIAALGRRHQILLITHMPAIAAIADGHWHLEKRVTDGRTRLHVEALDAEGQVAELAHLASGDARSEAANDHARDLLARAKAYKGQEVLR
jgi:DNA repair protein RecN (Recombination protein N)